MQQRVLEPEVMDDPALNADRHDAALAGLRRLNAISFSARLVWSHIKDLAEAASSRNQTLRVLDVATGSGDLPVALHAIAKRTRLPVEFAGCDISSRAVEAADAQAARRGAAVRFFEADVLQQPLPGTYDVVMCSLFLHHLSNEDAVTLLGRMREASGSRVLINDLARGRANLAMVWLASRIVTRCDVVHIDGPRSVRAAFKKDEAVALAAQAGMPGARVTSHLPCRFVMTWDHD